MIGSVPSGTPPVSPTSLAWRGSFCPQVQLPTLERALHPADVARGPGVANHCGGGFVLSDDGWTAVQPADSVPCMTYIIRTTDDIAFETPEVGHQADGSISIIVDGSRKLRLSAFYWTVIEGSVDQ